MTCIGIYSDDRHSLASLQQRFRRRPTSLLIGHIAAPTAVLLLHVCGARWISSELAVCEGMLIVLH